MLALLLVALPGTAFAQAYPPSAAELTVSASVVAPGGVVTVSGDGFAPGATITITFESTPVVIGVVEADASGRFTADVRIPADATPGAHTIRATGLGADGRTRVLSARITVTGAVGEGAPALSPPPAAGGGAPAAAPARPAPARGGVAFTGANIALVAAAALVLLGGGVLFLAIAGRRTAPDRGPEA